MRPYEAYPLLAESEIDGFTYGAITPLGANSEAGSGFLQGPDGSRAGIEWEVSDGPYIARIESPDGERWGVYRLGFTTPVTGLPDLLANLRTLLPKLKILYSRARVH